MKTNFLSDTSGESWPRKLQEMSCHGQTASYFYCRWMTNLLASVHFAPRGISALLGHIQALLKSMKKPRLHNPGAAFSQIRHTSHGAELQGGYPLCPYRESCDFWLLS